MSTTRGGSHIPASSTPLRTTAHSAAPRSTRSTRSSRAASSTPQRATSADLSSQVHPHGHHITADEWTLQEAQKILSTPVGKRFEAGSVGTPGSATSARERRHAKINEAREHAEHQGDDDETASSSGSVIASSSLTRSKGLKSELPTAGTNGHEDEEYDDDCIVAAPVESAKFTANGQRGRSVSHGKNGQNFDTTRNQASSGDTEANIVSAILDVPSDDDQSTIRPQSNNEEAQEESDDEAEALDGEASESVSGTSDSEDDSESDSEEEDEESESDTSDEDSDEEEERLERLLQAAKISALAKQPAGFQSDPSKDAQTGEVVLQFNGEEKKAAPIPDLKIPSLPTPHISFSADGSAKASTSTLTLGPAKKASKSIKGKEKAVVPELELDDRPYERELSKREKAAQPRKATASELWATLPSARADALPQMKRDYQALALANSLDPKRFMKGGNKANKVPERFAIGTMVEQSRTLKDTTLTRDVLYRPGQIVQNLVRDQTLGGTAKRKYEDLQHKRMENGRGKGWKKRTKW